MAPLAWGGRGVPQYSQSVCFAFGALLKTLGLLPWKIMLPVQYIKIKLEVMWRWFSKKLAGVVRLLSRSRLRVEPHCGLSSKNGPDFCDTQSWPVSDLKNICFDVYFEISYIKCKCRQLFQSIIQSLFELISMIYGNTVKNCSGVKIFMILISWMFGVSTIITVFITIYHW